MAEENGDNTVTHENMELESDGLQQASEAPTEDACENSVDQENIMVTPSHLKMTEKIYDDTIAPENMELESDDFQQTSEVPTEEACDNSIDRENMVSGTDAEESDSLAEETTDLVEQVGGDLENNSDKDMIKETSPAEQTDSSDGNVKKSLTAVIVGANHKFAVRSRYLSGSMSSCHDYCKYGHKHEQEKKTPKRPVLRTIREAQPLVRTTADDLATTVLNKETKKKSFLRRLSLPSTTARKDPPTPTRNIDRPKVEVNRPKLKRIQSEMKPASVSTSQSSSSGSKTDVQVGKKTVARSLTLPGSTNPRIKDIKTRKEAAGNQNQGDKERGKKPMSYSVSPKTPISNTASPKTPLKRSSSIKAKLYKNLRSSSRKNQSSPGSGEANINESGDAPEKKSLMRERKTETKPAKKALKTSPTDKNSPNTPTGAHVRKIKGSKSNQKGSSSASLATVQEPSQPNRENKRDLGSVRTAKTGTIKADGGSRTNTPKAKPTADRTMKAKKIEEKESSAWKVKFKRGTVVALQVANSAPKKLRFKRARILGDDQTKDGTSRSLKNEDTGNEPNDSKAETGKVQLRHQQASEKKDNVDLNNVIEETASKLVKTRKSKVKALVGAFETVMSLRDRKPLVEAGAS